MAIPDAETANATFPLFGRLPLELRDYIWTLALPKQVEPGFFFYNTACWKAVHIQPDHPMWVPGLTLILEFQESAPVRSAINLPHLNVSHESRRVAMRWCTRQGNDVELERRGHQMVACSGFNNDRDILYCSMNLFDAFVNQPHDTIIGQTYSPVAPMKHIAMPYKMAKKHPGYMPEFLELVSMGLTTFSVVVDPQPQLVVDDPRPWRTSIVTGGGFSWNHETGKFEPHFPGQRVQSDALYKVLEKARDEFQAKLSNEADIEDFVIQPLIVEQDSPMQTKTRTWGRLRTCSILSSRKILQKL